LAESVATARRNPFALRTGFAHDFLDTGNQSGSFDFDIGSNISRGCSKILLVHDHVLISIDPPEEPGAPRRLNAEFFDDAGRLACEIVANEIRVKPDNWDVELIGTTTTIRSGPGRVVLEMVTQPGQPVRVTRLDTFFEGVALRLRADGAIEYGSRIMAGMQAIGCLIGIDIASRRETAMMKAMKYLVPPTHSPADPSPAARPPRRGK
jgi:hypothetical protein